MAKVSAKGGFHLLWGLVLSTVISSIGTILIAIFLGADNMGLYTIAIGAPNLIATFRDWGITTAMVKYSAQYNHQNDTEKIRSILVSGLAFELILGLALTLFSIAISGFLADIFQRPEIAQLIQITSLFILTGALVNTASAAFTGLERMHLNSIMLIIQSIVKTGLIIGLVLTRLRNPRRSNRILHRPHSSRHNRHPTRIHNVPIPTKIHRRQTPNNKNHKNHAKIRLTHIHRRHHNRLSNPILRLHHGNLYHRKQHNRQLLSRHKLRSPHNILRHTRNNNAATSLLKTRLPKRRNQSSKAFSNTQSSTQRS